MTEVETVAKNTAFLTAGELVTRVLSFLLVVGVARYLGDIGLGAFAFAFAFTDLLLNFADLGIPTYVTREIAKNKATTGSYVSNVFGLRLAMAPLILMAGIVAAFVINATTAQTRLILILATAGMALNFLTDSFRTVFIAHQRAAYYSALIILERLIFAAGGLAMLMMGYGLVPVLGMFVLSHFVSLLTTSYVVRKKFATFSIRFDKAAIIQIVRKSSMFWISNFLRVMYQRADTLMLSAIKGFAATGLYGAAYRITEALTFIPIVVVTALFPALSKLNTQSKESVKMVYEKALYYMLIAAVPMAVGLTLTADRVVLFFYGQEFAASIIALKLLVWAEALIFVHYIMGFLLNAIDKQHLFTIVTAAYTAANIVLNLALIPRYSYIGAGITAVITQAIAVLALYYLCTKNGYGFNVFKLIYKPAIAASGMAVALAGLKGTHLLIAAPAAAAVYITLLAAVRGVGKEELGLIRKVFSR